MPGSRMRSARYSPMLFLVWVLAACSPPPLVQQQSYVFGTLVEISVIDDSGSRAKPAIAEVLARFDELHQRLHAWQPSELSRLNAALANGERVTVTPELASMLLDAQTLSVQSGDLFNPAIGGLIAVWGFHADTPQSRVPDSATIAGWVKQQPRMSDLHIENNTVWSDNPAVQLDLGGYAKGRALDDAVAILKKWGIKSALVNIGGNVIALGQHSDRPWRVGIQHPREPGTLAMLELHDGEAIGTSGDYQRYFEVGGRRYCHVIDPRSGWPASGMQSMTVLVTGKQAGTHSDALSKPLFIGGTARLAETAARLGVTDYLAVDATGQMHVSAAMQARLR